VTRAAAQKRGPTEVFLYPIRRGGFARQLGGSVLWAAHLVLFIGVLNLAFVLVAPMSHPFVAEMSYLWIFLITVPSIVTFSALRDVEPLLFTQGKRVRWDRVRLLLAFYVVAFAIFVKLVFAPSILGLVFFLLGWATAQAVPGAVAFLRRTVRVNVSAVAAAVTLLIAPAIGKATGPLLERMMAAPIVESRVRADHDP
jgi:hypothetical protein